MKHIVKRKGHTELFDERKLYASVYSACMAVRAPEGSAELSADKVTAYLKDWLEDKKEVTARDIHRQAARHLQVYNPDAALLYETHHILS